MFNNQIYEDIARRTGGDIYVGVVGPVRTGKSTFIRKFAEQLIVPNVKDANKRAVLTDELPQAAEGKTVMTTEPKFVPGEAVGIDVKENAHVRVRLIDCVGFMVEGAQGATEDGKPRLVSTPWSDTPVPFDKAAETGTQKVIREHSTIGVMVTCDGSVAGIERSGYIAAEERTVNELKAIGKPFVVVLNCRDPQSEQSAVLRGALEEKYAVPVLAMNCERADGEELMSVLEKVLFEFPVVNVDFKIPLWMQALPAESRIISEILLRVKETCAKVRKMRDCSLFDRMFEEEAPLNNPISVSLRLGEGRAEVEVTAKDGLFYSTLSEECGEEICDDFTLMRYVKSLKEAKTCYEKFKNALASAEETGYGVVTPGDADLVLDAPDMVKQGKSCGIRLKGNAASYHIMKIEVKSEVNPVLGTAMGSEEIVKGMLDKYDADPESLWSTDMFGKTFRDMVKDGLNTKVFAMPEDAKRKMRRTITRIVNEGRGGVICILL